ncbi:MAG: DUF917 family protein, partial [Candidatus Rokubacteria bacterium]|nr:DUF917 family protein [Candidatus Rokubacteria bacterium]
MTGARSSTRCCPADEMTLAFAATLFGLGLAGAFLAGLLGVGGAIIMIPLLLYVPPLLDVGRLSVKAVSGVTMAQVLVAAVSGMLAHRRHKAVDGPLALVGGLAMAAGSLAGAAGSYWLPDRWLLVVFAAMVTAAAALMLVPVELGGGNACVSLAVGAEFGRAVVDGDYSGRAVPSGYQTGPAIVGKSTLPMSVADAFGNVCFIERTTNLRMAERIGKYLSLASFIGCGMTTTMLSGAEMKEALYHNTLTECYELGRT